jgi:hypothetical protein
MLPHFSLHRTLLLCFANGKSQSETAEAHSILQQSNVAGGEDAVGMFMPQLRPACGDDTTSDTQL